MLKGLTVFLAAVLTILNIIWFVFSTAGYERAKIDARPVFTIDYYEIEDSIITQKGDSFFDKKYPKRKFPTPKLIFKKELQTSLREAFVEKGELIKDDLESFSNFEFVIGLSHSGGRQAKSITIEMDQYISSKTSPHDFIDPSDFYSSLESIKKIDTKKFGLGEWVKGDGMIIPLFTFMKSEAHPSQRIIGTFYIPRKIHYFDDVEKEERSIDIRNMLDNSIVVHAGVASRG